MMGRQGCTSFKIMNMKNTCIALLLLMPFASSCLNRGTVSHENSTADTLNIDHSFGSDSAFLAKYTKPVFLSRGQAALIISPEYQGRVMTSTDGGSSGPSFGWVNYDLISSGKTVEKINPVGGEDRIWLGPEGGQYSLFFPAGSDFVYKNWQTPAVLDTQPFNLVSSSDTSAIFTRLFELHNYAGTIFDIRIDRRINLLSSDSVLASYGITPGEGIRAVGYESVNRMTNTGNKPWNKEGGLVSIWILGMYVPSPSVIIFAPYKNGPEDQDKPALTTSYFGDIPPANLKVTDRFVFFKGDGKYRSKIGIPPEREGSYIAAYDADNKILTVVRHSKAPEGSVYVNSLWEKQKFPFRGDAVNAYNDGPLADGGQLGPFYELETSSPGAQLGPGEELVHIQRTEHFTGDEKALDRIAVSKLGISLSEVKNALK